MIPSIQKTYDVAGASAARNKVLRNTYWLLALSMVPTVIGAAVGMTIMPPTLMSGGMGFLLFMLVAFGFIAAINKTKDSAAGVGVLLGFTGFMGLMLAPLLTYTLRFSNGPALIAMAFGGTACVFAVMASIATVSKRDFSGMQSWLTVGAVVLILAMVANMFLHLTALHLAMGVMAIGIFSAFILVDVQRIVNGGETNYITATLSIYLDVYNIFSWMLSLLGFTAGSRD